MMQGWDGEQITRIKREGNELTVPRSLFCVKSQYGSSPRHRLAYPSWSNLTFPHKVRPGDALADGILVRQVRVGHEGAVQPGPEPVEALGVVFSEVQQFWPGVSCEIRGCCRKGEEEDDDVV
jgi:hypothetical protein